MIKRHLEDICFKEEFGHQMCFISGPRQVGKTTLSKNFLHQQKLDKLYFNWDLRAVRNQYLRDPYFFETDIYDAPSLGKPVWVCLDEIHKMPKWKNILKDYFDKFEQGPIHRYRKRTPGMVPKILGCSHRKVFPFPPASSFLVRSSGKHHAPN